MAWEVLSNLSHDGTLYKAGQKIEELEQEVAAGLEKDGIIKNLEATAGQVDEQVKQDAGTVENQAKADEELQRGQVDEQVADNLKQDLADNEKIANTPGQEVVNNKPSGILGKAKQALSGTPSADQIANDPQLK